MEEDQSHPLPEDAKNQASSTDTNPPMLAPKPYQPRVRAIILVLLAAVMGGMLLGPLLYQGLAMLLGWDSSAVMSGTFSAEASGAERAQMRLFLGLSHLTTFVLSGVFTVWFFYKGLTINGMPHWADYLGLRRWPNARTLGLAILLMLVSMPLVLFLYNVNKALPLPDVLRNLESDTNEAIKGLLKMEGIGELLANLLIIALIPAIGEELLFRGLLQQQLMRRIANPLVAILVTALVFSFIHFQFEGFFSRAFLGLLLGWMYWRTGNFWVPAAAHFLNNGLQVVGQYLYGQNISTVDLEQDIDIHWAAALVSAVLVWGIVQVFPKRATAAVTE